MNHPEWPTLSYKQIVMTLDETNDQLRQINFRRSQTPAPELDKQRNHLLGEIKWLQRRAAELRPKAPRMTARFREVAAFYVKAQELLSAEEFSRISQAAKEHLDVEC